MAFDANNLVLHIRKLVRSSIRLGYHSACDHPEVLGAGTALLFLHGLWPSLFAFVLSSSPVIVLTALLLGALLSYGEAAVPLDGEETLEEHESLSLKSNIYVGDCSNKEVENIAVKVQLEKRTETDSSEVHVRERASDCMHDALCEEKNVTYIASDAALLSETYVEEERTPDDSLHGTHCEEKNVTFVADDTVRSAEPCNHPDINATLECEERAKEISEKAELQEPGSTCTGSCNNGVHYQYQFGEFMRSCWQPVMRQDLPYCDSESDLTDESSSPDASMTDIIPMLEDLHPLINLGTGQLSLASRENLNSSSDDNEYDLEEEKEEEEQDDSVSSDDDEGAERQQDNEVNWKDVVHLNCLDMEQNDKLENPVELQRAKNMLKFELDMRSIDLQAADATRKLKDASSFHVQVPSICTPRHNPFNPSRDSEESIELPQIPGSAPSVLLRRRNLFDLPFDRVVDQRSRFQESWTPRSRFRSAQAQNMKHRNSCRENHSTYNGEMGDGHSDDDAEQEGINGKLFGSLEAHLGEEMKILSAAISDVGVLGEVNHETDQGNRNANVSDDATSLSGVHNSEPHGVEADSMSEMNSLFKCRMEEMLVQSVSESSVCQPLGVKPEAIPSAPLSSDSWMHANKASSIDELNFQFLTADEEALACAASGLNGHSESIRDQSSESLRVVYEQRSELPIELDGCIELSTGRDQQTAGMSEPNETLTAYCDELPVVEASSVQEMNSLFDQLEEEEQPSNGRTKMDIPQDGLCEAGVDLVELSLDHGLSAP